MSGLRSSARPRRRLLRTLIGLVVAAGVVYLLFTTVFPWVEQRLENPTMQMSGPLEDPVS